MAWVRIDEEFYDHPRWAEAPGDSIALWLAAMAWCNRNDSIHGFIPTAKTNGLVNVRNVRRTCADLVERGAFEPTPGGYVIHDYEEFQQPEKVKAIREKKVAAGKKGAKARWHPNGTADAIADGMADAIANEWPVPGPDPVSGYECSNDDDSAEQSPRSSSSIEAVAAAIVRAAAGIIADRRTDVKNRHAFTIRTGDNLWDERPDDIRALAHRGGNINDLAIELLDGPPPAPPHRHDPNCPNCEGTGLQPDHRDEHGEPASGARWQYCPCTEPDTLATVTQLRGAATA